MQKKEKAYFAAGCFWGVEEAFFKTPGVIDTKVGYSGGHVDNPTYEEVSSHTTGHAETVEVTFDPQKIKYEQLLDVFWKLHDPTTMNQQGPDIGSNYRSVIFYLDDEQKNIAENKKQELEKSGKFKKPIVTEIRRFTKFWPAEEYHQKYFQKNPGSHACAI